MTQQIKVNVDVFQMIKIHHVVQKLYMHDGAGELLEMGHGLFARDVCEYCQWFRASMAQKGNTGFHVGGKGIAMILNVGTTLNLGGVEADFII